jgi:peptidyl-prolyl cis-trans isomerase A (cyclophilin A)
MRVFLLLLAASTGASAEVRVRVVTSAGDIVMALDDQRAPRTTANFLHYVDAGHYANGRFHRTVRADNQPDSPVKIDVIQAGPDRNFKADPPIPLEGTSVTGLHHRDGTVSMARGGPDTATRDFFICIGDQPELDFAGKRNADRRGFAAFGKVVSGMDVVKRIHASPAEKQALKPPIAILRIERIP